MGKELIIMSVVTNMLENSKTVREMEKELFFTLMEEK